MRTIGSPFFSSFASIASVRAFFGGKGISSKPSTQQADGGKRIVFIRHGCTYMNEYLALPGKSFGSPDFSDIFSGDELHKYLDSKLSSRGVGQAQALNRRLGKLGQPRTKEEARKGLRLSHEDQDFVNDLDLVVVSPLTRALETYDIGVREHVPDDVPVISLPDSAERLYLVSDIGRRRSELEKEYGSWCNFQEGFVEDDKLVEDWWFSLDDNMDAHALRRPSGYDSNSYVEWRPILQNQEYGCPGEPDDVFEARMMRLYSWLKDREESTIAVVCHWGVLDWMLGVDFHNCELRVVPFGSIQPKSMVPLDQEVLSR